MWAAALLAIRATSADSVWRRSGRSTVGGRQLLRRLLVVAQVALAIVLLAGAGLLIRSFTRLQQVSLGFDSQHVWTFRMSAQWSDRTDVVVARQARTISRLSAIPGVESAAFSQLLPGGLDIPPGEFHIVGRDSTEKTCSIGRSVSAGYFRTLHIPILQGETCSIDQSERPFSKALVTRAFADRVFAGEDAIGHDLTSPGFAPGTSARIVGIVGDVRESGMLKEVQPVIYWCGYHPYWPDQYFIVRSEAGRPMSMNTIRAALREIEPRRAVYDARLLDESLSDSILQQRISTILLVLFAVTAVLLAAMGLYGVLAQLVSSRRLEIGVRMALGARPAQIVRSVAGPAATMTAAGVVVGLAGAFVLARFMTSVVFGISTRDPVAGRPDACAERRLRPRAGSLAVLSSAPPLPRFLQPSQSVYD